MKQPRPPRAPKISEAELQDGVIELAIQFGWMVYHCRPGRRADGSWRTAIQGHAGFPDLVLVKGPRTLFAELKSATGTISPEQAAWAFALKQCPGIEYHLWTPDMWIEQIREILTNMNWTSSENRS